MSAIFFVVDVVFSFGTMIASLKRAGRRWALLVLVGVFSSYDSCQETPGKW